MPSYFVNEASADTFLPNDFVEEAGSMEQPGGGASFTDQSGEAVLVGTIPYNKQRDARNKMLGLHWADESTPYALHRTVPWRHPIWPMLRAYDVNFVGFNPAGTVASTAKMDAAVPGEDLNRCTRYTRARTTIRFKTFPYYFATDTQLAGASELFRNCAIFDTLDPSLELLMAESQPFLKFIEGPQYSADADKGLVNAPVPEYIAKCLFVLGWFSVPWDFVAQPYKPSKIMKCVGYVNGEDDWLAGVGFPGTGFPKGTLLLEAPRIKKSVQPVWTQQDRISFLVDIFFPFKFVDPFPGTATAGTDPPSPAPTYRGWNLFPFSRTGKWWSIGRKDSTDTPKAPYLGFKNFSAAFTSVLGPTVP